MYIFLNNFIMAAENLARKKFSFSNKKDVSLKKAQKCLLFYLVLIKTLFRLLTRVVDILAEDEDLQLMILKKK